MISSSNFQGKGNHDHVTYVGVGVRGVIHAVLGTYAHPAVTGRPWGGTYREHVTI